MTGRDPRIGIKVFAIRREKITGYLLDLQHPVGAPKAAFFLARGFSRDRPDDLEHVLRQHGRTGELVGLRTMPHGEYVVIGGGVLTPLNRVIHITSVWAIRRAAPEIADLVTTYPSTR